MNRGWKLPQDEISEGSEEMGGGEDQKFGLTVHLRIFLELPK